MTFKMKGWSAFKQIKVEPAKTASIAPKAEAAPTAITYEEHQDIIKSNNEQVKDLDKDIKMLLRQGASSDDKRIISLHNEIKRLKLKK